MKILIISHMYPNSSNRIAGIFVHEQVKELIKQGHEVRVLSPIPYTPFPIPLFKKKWKEISNIPKEEVYEGVEIYFPRYISFPKLKFENITGEFMYLGIEGTVKKLFKENTFDLVHAHVVLPDGFAGMKVSKLLNIPLFVTVHGKDFSSSIYNSKSYLAIEKTLNYANGVVLVSKRLENIRVEKLPHIKKDKIEVIYNGVGNIFLNTNLKEKSSSEILKILSVSNLIRTKGIDLNLYAMADLIKRGKNVQYNIIGEGIEKENLENLSKELGISKFVNFLGRKTQQEVKDHIEECDVFSLPSWNEAFGVVYIEAMAMGKPIIGCRGQGIEEIIDNGVNGYLISPQNHIELTQILMNIDEETRKKVGIKAKNLVFKNYTWKINVKKTMLLYEKVISRKQGE